MNTQYQNFGCLGFKYALISRVGKPEYHCTVKQFSNQIKSIFIVLEFIFFYDCMRSSLPLKETVERLSKRVVCKYKKCHYCLSYQSSLCRFQDCSKILVHLCTHKNKKLPKVTKSYQKLPKVTKKLPKDEKLLKVLIIIRMAKMARNEIQKN